MNARLNQAQEWLQAAIDARWCAVALADQMGVSGRQLRRRTRRLFGMSAQAWLNEQRLRMAAEMLKDANSVKWVARELAFKQESHFSREFKRRFRMSPTEFITAGDGDKMPMPAEREANRGLHAKNHDAHENHQNVRQR